jgi:molybdopterin converting factor subunit 1
MMVGVDDLGFCGGVEAHAGTMLLGSGTAAQFCCGFLLGCPVGYRSDMLLVMRVRLLYFGILRERLGGGESRLEMRDGATVAEVLNVYRERLPDFMWDSIAVAVNQEYTKADFVLKDGDEVALLPPVSGGSEGLGTA